MIHTLKVFILYCMKRILKIFMKGKSVAKLTEIRQNSPPGERGNDQGAIE